MEHCGASIRHNGNCELYIGLTGYTNTSYSVLAYMDEGFKHPTTLFDGQAQSGAVKKGDYTYYSFQISLPDNELATAVSFTMTPTSEGDADMFLVLRPDGGQPGRNNADYKTSNGAGQVDIGGNLDVSGGVDIDADSVNLTIGASADLLLVHNGSKSIIQNATGHLIIDNTANNKAITKDIKL